ncbi:DMT family transporter [Alphaproteobacteria bacterium]|nr:DMT family transporter [Alphaproteobacteria bacterium]
MIGYVLAISAAAIWSAVALSATRIVRYFGSYNYNLLRLVGIIVIFSPYVFLKWEPLYFENSIFLAIFLSSVIGIIIGDTFLFICLKRLGPRRQALLFSMQIPFTIVLAEIFLQSLPSLTELIGCVLIFSGILIAIQFNRSIPNDDLENIQGNKYTGLLAGIGLALCQSIGIILMKPALGSTDPIIVSYLRIIIAAIIMFGSLFFIKNNQLWEKMKDYKKTIFSVFLGFMGMGVGMTMLIFALKFGNPGVISSLSSTMPIMIIPILWIVTKNYAGNLAVIGAGLTCLGAGIIFLA